VLHLEGVPSNFTGSIAPIHLIYGLPPMEVGGECSSPTFCGIAAREVDSWPDPDDFWFFNYSNAQGEQCKGMPLGSAVTPLPRFGQGLDDEGRLYTLQEDETCDSPAQPPPLYHPWRLEVQFTWQ
jgi:hypothetical protein